MKRSLRGILCRHNWRAGVLARRLPTAPRSGGWGQPPSRSILRAIASGIVIVATPVLAAPTNEQFFQSVRENIDKPVDPTKFIAGAMVVVGLVLILVMVTRKKEQRAAKPKVLNHPGKLLKEISSAIHLKPAEVRQLKLLSEGQEVSSPLTLLLCPSVFAKAVRAKSTKVDRRVLAQLAKKLVQSPPHAEPKAEN